MGSWEEGVNNSLWQIGITDNRSSDIGNTNQSNGQKIGQIYFSKAYYLVLELQIVSEIIFYPILSPIGITDIGTFVIGDTDRS